MARTWGELKAEMYDYLEMSRTEELRHPLLYQPQEPSFRDAPVIIVLCGDRRTYQATVLRGTFFGGDGGIMEAPYLKNMANVAQNMHLAAASLGLGSGWLSVPLPWEEALKTILDVPPILDIHSAVVVGYPAYEPPPLKRRELKEMVHYEKYDKSKYRSGMDILNWLLSSRPNVREVDKAFYKK